MGNRKALDYARQIKEKLDQVCQPLMDQFPILDFGYLEFPNQKEFTVLSQDVTWLDGLFESSPDGFFEELITHALRAKGYFSFMWSSINATDESLKRLYDQGYLYGLNFYFLEGTTLKQWGFASKSPHAFHLFQTHKDALEQFVVHFQNKSSDFITPESLKANRAHWKTPMLLNFDHVIEKEKKRQSFEASIQPKKRRLLRNEHSFLVTQKQWEQIKYYAQGYSMKEIAQMLNLSPRSVESTLQIIRDRGDLYSKSDFLKLYHENKF